MLLLFNYYPITESGLSMPPHNEVAGLISSSTYTSHSLVRWFEIYCNNCVEYIIKRNNEIEKRERAEAYVKTTLY
jgi:hypothetical protein